MRVGIEKISLYAGRLYLDMVELAQARGKDLSYVNEKVMCQSRTVIPPYEDAVTLAVNAAKRLLTPEDRRDIELLIVATESAVDFGKPVSTWVHRFCELSPNCRNFELKHACYGGPAALRMAAAWVASGMSPGKKALVISSDYSRAHLDDGYELALGGCATALLVSANPAVLELELDKTGYWTLEIADTFRPTSRTETGNNQISLYAYLDALEGSYEHLEQRAGPIDYDATFKKHIYHAPFPGMTFEAHRVMLGRFEVTDPDAVAASFRRKVAESITFARRIGSAYGSSNAVCLMGLLHTAEDLQPGDRISLFSYGSGCQGELSSALIGPSARDHVRAQRLDQHLDERMRLTVEQYELTEYMREQYIDCPTFTPRRGGLGGAYERMYQGQGLLVLQKVENHLRTYGWS